MNKSHDAISYFDFDFDTSRNRPFPPQAWRIKIHQLFFLFFLRKLILFGVWGCQFVSQRFCVELELMRGSKQRRRIKLWREIQFKSSKRKENQDYRKMMGMGVFWRRKYQINAKNVQIMTNKWVNIN